MPAAVLQGALFSSDRPGYTNYGGIGQIIGHELAHSFDNTVGQQFDLNGNVVDWWMPETKLKLLNKTQCIIDQYGRFIEPNINVNVSKINLFGGFNPILTEIHFRSMVN